MKLSHGWGMLDFIFDSAISIEYDTIFEQKMLLLIGFNDISLFRFFRDQDMNWERQDQNHEIISEIK